MRTASRSEETSAACVNAEAALKHLECSLGLRAKEARDESRWKERWIVVRELLLQFFHVIATIAVPQVPSEIEAGLGSRGRASATTRVLSNKLENLRLQGLDLIEKRLDLGVERRAS